MIRCLWFAALLIQQTSASYESLLDGKSKFQNIDEVKTFLSSIDKLNRIQSRLFGVELPADDESGLPFADKVSQMVPQRPDNLPYLYQGDIILTNKQIDSILSGVNGELKKKDGGVGRDIRSITSDLSERWNFPIPYFIDTSTGVDQNAVQAGINKWQELTCATFQRRNSLFAGNGLQFIRGDGCYSYIGETGGIQQVSIGTGCTLLGTVTHEIGHALGFYHEQARPERDSYVTIETRNIQSIYLSQFSKQSPQTVISYTEYDYGSVMHYDGYGFSSNGGQTIKTLDKNYQNTIGQREMPSFADVKQINFAYCNSSCTLQLDCRHGGYTDPKNCAVCRCPDGLGGTLCDQVAPSLSASCGAGELTATSDLQSFTASGDKDCYYRITAPEGRRVFLQFNSISFPQYQPCTSSFLQVKYRKNFVLSGFRVCGSTAIQPVTSEGNSVIVIYYGSASSRFNLSYRYDPPTPPSNTTSTPVVTTPTPASTTAPTTSPGATTAHPRPGGDCVWSQCTANCGGCGTQTAVCESRVQTRYCNFQPCQGGFCCQPFFLNVWQGRVCSVSPFFRTGFSTPPPVISRKQKLNNPRGPSSSYALPPQRSRKNHGPFRIQPPAIPH